MDGADAAGRWQYAMASVTLMLVTLGYAVSIIVSVLDTFNSVGEG